MRTFKTQNIPNALMSN